MKNKSKKELIVELEKAYSQISMLEEAQVGQLELERELRKSEERFRSLIEASSDWIWEVNTDGIYTYISPQIEKILGYMPEDLIGKRPFDIMATEESKRVSEIFFDLLQSAQPIISLENTGLHKNGSQIILETSGAPFFDKDGKLLGYRGKDRDITGKKSYENERENLIGSLAHRSMLLQTAAKVFKSVLTILSPNELLIRMVELIQEHFNYYYVGVFLIDADKEFAILKTGTGKAGKKMVANGHKLRIDENS